jgi:hypothetical protein
MVSHTALLSGVFEIIVGMLLLGAVIYEPPVDQPPRAFIGIIGLTVLL